MLLTGNSNRAANRGVADTLGSLQKSNKKQREQIFVPLKYRSKPENGILLKEAKQITKQLKPLTWEETLAKYGAKLPPKKDSECRDFSKFRLTV